MFWDYREGRVREGPYEILKDFRGHYKRMAMLSIEDCDNLTRAEYALTEMQKLYGVGHKAKTEELSPRSAI